jgi:HEAT repeat protein
MKHQMKHIAGLALTIPLMAFCLPGSVGADEISLQSAPPVVVRTVPVAGATEVDPSLTEIKVTYSKTMQDGSWSWSTWGEENYPKTTGKPHYLPDNRTCVLPVQLEPGRFYALWLNSEKFKNFKDAGQRPAVSYLLTFTTAGASAASAQEPGEVMAQAIRTISQCAEGDPRVAEAMTRLRSVPSSQLIPGLVPYLDSSTDTIRRAAVYVLWKGGFTDLASATGPLQKLLAHAEDLTRGMAALALGQNHAGESFEALSQMTRDDKSGYARRCAAYALGLLGDARAEPVLKAALADPEAMVAANAKAALELLKSAGGSKPPSQGAASATKPTPSDAALLNEDQRAVLAWTDRQFRSFFDARTFEGWSEKELADQEARLIDALKGPQTREYFQAINTLGTMRSTNALPRLREIAFERADKNNRDRWMAIRALGLIGDKTAVPELIHLVYHGNSNTRWWAQITLVRLTGHNFATDWSAWAKWWTDSGGQPPYQGELIRWWNGQAEPDKLAETLAESDRKFLGDVRR